MFFKVGVLKNFAIFSGKHSCLSLFLTKLLVATSEYRQNYRKFTEDLYPASQFLIFNESYYLTDKNVIFNMVLRECYFI